MKHIFLIAWLYIVILFAAGTGSVMRAINILLFLGAIPVGLYLWVSLRKVHQRQRALREAQEEMYNEDSELQAASNDADVDNSQKTN
ncbi:hypothetical protein LIN78_17385 [Leeia sp. TBRC 13508]|uniref:Uncharacterized protein n=1 Tax=Leeia speluncae TaxID=2884804 RepID=A0ABS8DBE1_9NEIS|nr:hypothetical protein [Leeia speluncae]MCB6185323.1 hypothetical protein [Leeia speluncae]